MRHHRPANQRAPVALILLIMLTQERLRVKSADWISCLWSRKSSNFFFEAHFHVCLGFLVRVSVMRAIDTIIVFFFKIKYGPSESDDVVKTRSIFEKRLLFLKPHTTTTQY